MASPERATHRARKTDAAKRPTWSDVKAHLAMMDRIGLMALIRDLYDLDVLNRRALHARFTPNSATVDQYRRLVRAAVFPDPLSQRPIRLRDATATIREYARATGDVVGTIHLMLEFVEAGTEQAADLGYGDDVYFTALEHKVNEVVRLLNEVPNNERRPLTERICRLGRYQGASGGAMATFSRMWRRKWRLMRIVRVARELDEAVETTDELGETY